MPLVQCIDIEFVVLKHWRLGSVWNPTQPGPVQSITREKFFPGPQSV
jgi:hypothetical protein